MTTTSTQYKFKDETMLYFYLILLSILQLISALHKHNYPQKTIYNKLTLESNFSGFAGLIRHNRDVQNVLMDDALTIFVPNNQAFDKYDDILYSEIAYYHMSSTYKTLDLLETTRNLTSAKLNFPKLWLTKTNDNELYVNNAKIIQTQSNYVGRGRGGPGAKLQVLHMIDNVLDPLIRKSKFPPTAYDFLTLPLWDINYKATFTTFLYKIQENQLSYLYQQKNRSFTYFIPIDSSIESYHFNMLNKHVIFAHIVPDLVLFTRPTAKNFTYETMANIDDVIYTVLSFVDNTSNDLYVETRTITSTISNNDDNSDSSGGNPIGTYQAKILYPNIPLANGVIHLISKPLCIKNKSPPFPYVSIRNKLATDPTLDDIWTMGETSGFNLIFNQSKVKFTYFIPNNQALKRMKQYGIEFNGNNQYVDLLKRHLILSDSVYSMERLFAMTNIANNTGVPLQTLGGIVKLGVHRVGKIFYIKFHTTYIRVLKANYQCTNGLIHILAGPIINL